MNSTEKELLEIAQYIFNDIEKARAFLKHPQSELNYTTPLQFAENDEESKSKVMAMLWKIHYGQRI